jgi:hypothetical protein
MRFEGQQFYLKSRAEMERLFAEVPEAVTNTEAVAEMCDIAIPFPKGSERYPKYPLPPEVRTDRVGYLRQLCIEGLQVRYGVDFGRPGAGGRPRAGPGPRRPARLRARRHRQDRLRRLLPRRLGLHRLGEEAGHPRRAGPRLGRRLPRGLPPRDHQPRPAALQAALRALPQPGARVPAGLRHRLLHAAPGRGDRLRQAEVRRRLRGQHRHLRDAGGQDGDPRRLPRPQPALRRGRPAGEDDPGRPQHHARAGVAKSAELRDEVAKNPAAKKIFEQARVLEGMVRNTGKHAAGIIITDRPLEEFVPLTLQEGDVTVQFDMNAVGKLGLLKMDFLGLKTLTVIADAVDNIRRTGRPGFRHREGPDRRREDLRAPQHRPDDRGVPAGVRRHAEPLPPAPGLLDRRDHRADRPLPAGPDGMDPRLHPRQEGPEHRALPPPLLEEVCRETYGVMVYQEQVMEAAKIIAGYTLGGADMLRRAMGKKDPEAMARSGASSSRARRRSTASTSGPRTRSSTS